MLTPKELAQIQAQIAQIADVAVSGGIHDAVSFFERLAEISTVTVDQWATEQICQPCEIVFEEGEIGEALYLILSGQMAVIKNRAESPRLLAVRGPGEMIGEMALLEERPRMATVAALCPTRLLRVTHDDFYQLLRVNPEFGLKLTRILSERLRVETRHAIAAFEERERMARQLHDSIGQTFSYITIQSETAREMLRKNDNKNIGDTLARISEVAREAHRDVREYIKGLKGTAEARQEFFEALRQYCTHLEQAYLFHVELRLPDVPPKTLASAQVETHLIYIIREALGNARRHSGADRASVAITLDDKYVQAVITDMGNGIATEYVGNERRKGNHLGLGIMRERVKEVGGSLRIESAPGQGTCITVRLPRRLSRESLVSSRILIVGDHPLFIEGLKNLLTQRGAQVVGAAQDSVEAQDLARDLKPDIVLMDVHMPHRDGLEATRRIKTELPGVKIVMLVPSIEERHHFDALSAGASGYLLKGMDPDHFMERLGEISRGEAEVSAAVAHQILAEFGGDTTETAHAELSERQLEILRLVSQGLMYKQIGERLFLTEQTIKYHLGEILTRLQLKNRREGEA